MKTRKPAVKETVGNLYYAFNEMTDDNEFNPDSYEETITSPSVKSIETTENSDSTTVRASGQDYTTVNQNSSTEIKVEVVAIHPDDLARMRGDDVSDAGGLILKGASNVRPYFAFRKSCKESRRRNTIRMVSKMSIN